MLPETLRGEVYARSSIVQLWFASDLGKKVHFEVWQRRGFVEVGLHFEADQGSNEWLYHAFSQRQAAIDDMLNDDPALPPVVAERWDKGWARVHCEMPTNRLRASPAEVAQIASRFAAIIIALQPICEELMGE